DQFKIKKDVPQNKPTVVLTKRLSHEFRNKIESPSAIRVRALIRILRSADDAGCIVADDFIRTSLLRARAPPPAFPSTRASLKILRAGRPRSQCLLLRMHSLAENVL